MFRKLLHLALGVFVALALTACDGSAELDRRFNAAIAEARTVPDPWKAYTTLSSKREQIILSADCGIHRCPVIAERSALGTVADQDLNRYLIKAAVGGNPAALVALYTHEYPDDEILNARKKLGARLLGVADNSQGKTPEEVQLIFVAGSVVAKGNYATLETERALGYFAKAWKAGAAQAANSAAHVFLSINDTPNAYLWSLRCTGECQRSYEVELSNLQKDLRPDDAQRIQALASTPATRVALTQIAMAVGKGSIAINSTGDITIPAPSKTIVNLPRSKVYRKPR